MTSRLVLVRIHKTQATVETVSMSNGIKKLRGRFSTNTNRNYATITHLTERNIKEEKPPNESNNENMTALLHMGDAK